ncbi:ATP-dependent protease [Vibrio phage K567]|nr:ATP-dependent Clp protease proteolytic subunit [Vibrio phage 6E35.1a]
MIFKSNVGWFAGAGSVRHDFYINGPIEEPNDYEEMLQILHTASETDAIYLHLNTPGGNFAAACQICDAIMQSKAGAVIACAEGDVCSAGTMIFLACNGWHVSPFSTFMFHTSSGGQIGKMPDTLKQAKAHEEHLNRVAGLLYDPFFSEDEIDQIINYNQDVWLTPEEVTERLTEMSKRFEAELKEAEEQIAGDLESQLEEQIAERVEAGVKAALEALKPVEVQEAVEAIEPEEVPYEPREVAEDE